ncbi:AmmeMemoRadiSam system protein B [Candidatus Parcubacteria bacterium]|nr:AmmeMemoRadiSam system protein B [Candidatus Parcubacteria bacterium]
MKLNKIKIIIILSLLLAGLIVFAVYLLKTDYQNNVNNKIDNKKSENFHYAEPNDLNFYETAYHFINKKADFKNQDIIGGIIPHHLLAADLIAEFFSNFNSDYETIILIGPNHFSAGKSKIISSSRNWQTPYGILEYDKDVINELLRFNKIKIEENIFEKEHAINSEVAFIKKTFPNAKFVPLVLRDNVDKKIATELALRLADIAKDKKVLILSSVDFSHYKDNLTAQKNDEISIEAIETFNFNEIYNLDIDSPASIYTLLKFGELNNTEFSLLNNSNSAVLSNKLNLKSTTSYVTGYFVSKEKNITQNNLPENKNIKRELKMLFFGDMMLDRYVNKKIKANGLDYLFEELASSTKENFFSGYDLISVNLEGTVTNNGEHYSPVMSYDFAFHPDIISQLKKYNFNFFNLANNHFADQGEQGIAETRKNLQLLDFDFSGCRDRKTGECSCKIIKKANKKIGMAGFSMVYGKLDESAVEKIISDLASTTDLVAVNIHWGVEYQHYFNKTQQNIAYKIIDAGADIIIGHHPHVVQGIEIYKNKPIFYSLGNFVFDQYFSTDTQEGLSISAVIDDSSNFYLFPLKSKSSQVSLMDQEEKNKFLQKLSDWSFVDDQIHGQIKKGKLEL